MDLPNHDNAQKWWKRIRPWWRKRTVCERRLIWLTVVVVVIFAGLYFFDYLPYASENKRLQAELKAARDRILRQENRIEDLNRERTALVEEVSPFRNFSVSKYGDFDAATMKRLAEHLARVESDLRAADQQLRKLETNYINLQSPERLAESLSSQTQHINISGKSTNLVVYGLASDGSTHVYFLLPSAPIQNTVRVLMQFDPGPGQLGASQNILVHTLGNNIIRAVFSPPFRKDVSQLRFDITYLANIRVTNLISKLEIRDRRLLFDGASVEFDKQHVYYD